MLAGGSAVAAPRAEAAKLKRLPCAGGQFLVQNTPLLIGGSKTPIGTIVIANGVLHLAGACSARVKLRVSKQGTTFIASMVGCPGIKGKLRVTGAFDRDCSALGGAVKGRKVPKARFTAKRFRCGDGVLDGEAGEQCEAGVPCQVGTCDQLACTCSGGATTTTTLPGNQSPIVGAGRDFTIVLPARADLEGSVSDDGLPNPPARVSVSWSKSSGPGTVTFDNFAATHTSASFTEAGTYVLRLTATDSVLSAFAEVTVIVEVGSGGDSRSAVLDAVAALMSTFDGSDQDHENLEMLAFVQGRSEFTESGLAEGGAVWARFPDGTTLVIGNNLIPTKPPPVAHSASARSRRTLNSENGIPETQNVVVAETLGTFYDTVNTDIEEMLSTQYYNRVPAGSSIDSLKTLSDVAVLYLDTHGAAIPLRQNGEPEYTIWTSTARARDGSTDAAYQDDLRDGSLTYFMAYVFRDGSAPGSVDREVELHYAITAKFVQKYWTGKFTKNSLVFMNACRSGSLDALSFELACLQAGAGAYLGWTDRILAGDAAISAAYFFDRILGANTEFPQAPPQRAFPYIDVLGNMQARQRSDHAYALDSSINPKTGLTATLTPLTLSTDFGLLAPSIRSLAVNEQADELGITGFFGDVEGVVQVGATELKIKSWDDHSILCELPRTGPGSAGDVKVTVYGSQFSNVVPLTAWHGTATYTVEEAGTLKMTMGFDVRFRGDIHAVRDTPGEIPASPSLAFEHSLVTSGTYEFSGRFDDPGTRYSEEWSGSGTMKSSIELQPGEQQTSENTVSCVGTITEGKWDMSILALAIKGNHVHATQRDPQGVLIYDDRHDADGVGVGNFDPPGSAFQAAVSGNSDIAGGKREVVVDSAFGGGLKAKHTLEWSEFTPESAPTSETTASLGPARRPAPGASKRRDTGGPLARAALHSGAGIVA